MKQALPWNVNGIPPEARELARAAAMRDGLSVGDWLTQRILKDDTPPAMTPETHDEPPPQPVPRPAREAPVREDERDREELASRLARSEAETDLAVRRLDEAVGAMSQRLESTEHSQNEARRAMSSAASEINAAARDQAQAFAHLAERIVRVERQSDNAVLREAVRGLHQGLSRLTEQLARSASDSASQVAAVAGNVEALSGKLNEARNDSEGLGKFVEERFALLSDRLNHAEERLSATSRLADTVAALQTQTKSSEERLQETLGHHLAGSSRLEETMAALEARMKTSEERAEEAAGQQLALGNRLDENFASLETKLKASEDSTQEALGRHLDLGNGLNDNVAALETRIKTSEDLLQNALAHHLALGNRLEENLAAFGTRLNDSEKRIEDALQNQAASGTRLEESLAVLQKRTKASEERMQETLGRHFAPGSRLDETLAGLEGQIKSSEERVQESVGRHLVVIGRNLDNILTRLEQAERRGDSESTTQEAVRLFSEQLEATEKKHRDTVAELKASLAQATRRIEAMEAAQRPAPHPYGEPAPHIDAEPLPHDPLSAAPPYAEPASQKTSAPFDLPPFADSPSFPGAGYSPLEPADTSSPAPSPQTADIFTPPSAAPPSGVQDYLAQARRAARAAAEQAANAAIASGGRLSTGRDEGERSRFSAASRIAAIVVLGLLVIGGAVLLLHDWLPGRDVAELGPNAAGITTELAPPSVSAPLANDAGPASDLSAFANQLGASGAQQGPGAAPSTVPAQNSASATKGAPAKSLAPAAPAPELEPLANKATAGDAKAALVLGLKYADGDGIPMNDSEAFRWLQQASKAGEALAQYRLGALYEKGRGVAADAKQATAWYAESAKRGNRKAMHNLAVAYADGSGLNKNFAEAVRWFKSAADLGLTDSQFNLAVMYERGFGVPASLTEAYKWYAIAGAQGDIESKTRVEALATQLKTAEKDAADKAVRAFKARPVNKAANDPPTVAQVLR